MSSLTKHPSSAQIVFAYESLGLTPEQITEQFEEMVGGLGEVVGILAEGSVKYRASLNLREEELTQDTQNGEELSLLLHEYRILSKIAENDLVKERALKFLINEHKGRNDLQAKHLALKEKQQGFVEVNTSKRQEEFMETMRKIQEKLSGVLP